MRSLGPTADDRAAGLYFETLREQIGLSKAELARRLGLRRELVQNYLDGKSAMTFGTFKAFANQLGVTGEEAANGQAAMLASLEDA